MLLLPLIFLVVFVPVVYAGGALDRARAALQAGRPRAALQQAIEAGRAVPPARRAEVLTIATRARAVLTRRLERAAEMRVHAATMLIGAHAIVAARRQLEKAVATAPLPHAHYELGNLLEFFDSTSDDNSKSSIAADHYRQAQMLALRRDAHWWRGRGAEGDGASPAVLPPSRRPCRAVMAVDVCKEPDVTCIYFNGITEDLDRRQRIARFRASNGVTFSLGGRDGVLFSTTAKAAAKSGEVNDNETGDDRNDDIDGDCRVFVGIHGRAEALHEQWTRFSDDIDVDITEGVGVAWHRRQLSEWRQRDRIALLTQPRSWSFFHFLLEIMPRLCLLASMSQEMLHQRAVLLDARAHTLLEEVWMPALPCFANDVVRRLELVAFQAEPRGVQLWRSPAVLWVGWTPPPGEVAWASYFLPAPGPLRLFQSAVRGACSPHTAPPSLAVVIARTGGGARLRQRIRVTNRDAVRQALTDAGWETHVVSQNGTSPSTAVALFRRADVVVGVHGGGLANIIFAPTGAHVFEAVVAQPGISKLYARLCAMLGHVHHILPTEGGRMLDYFAGGRRRGGEVVADVRAFTAALVGLLRRRGEQSTLSDGL